MARAGAAWGREAAGCGVLPVALGRGDLKALTAWAKSCLVTGASRVFWCGESVPVGFRRSARAVRGKDVNARRVGDVGLTVRPGGFAAWKVMVNICTPHVFSRFRRTVPPMGAGA